MNTYSRRGLAALAATLTSLIATRFANAAGPDNSKIVGTWKMVDAVSKDPSGKVLPKPYGPKGMGLVTLNADGRMMAVLCDGRNTLPDGTARDYASSAARLAIGGDQVRKVRFEGKRLVLIPPPTMLNGVEQHREIFWERISPIPA